MSEMEIDKSQPSRNSVKYQVTGMFCMMLASILWSLTGLFVKLLTWNVFVTLSLRGFATVLTLYLYMRFKGIPVAISRGTLTVGVFLGMCNTLFIMACKLTSSANAVVLQYTSPIYIALFFWLFKKNKPRTQDITALVLTLIGILVIFSNQISHGGLQGDILAALSGIMMAGMHISNGKLKAHEHLSGLMLGQLFNGLTAFPALITSNPSYTLTNITLIIFMGSIQMCLSYLLFARASKTCKPLSCSLLSTIEPVLNPIWVFLLLGEVPSINSIIGGIIVVTAVTSWNALNIIDNYHKK